MISGIQRKKTAIETSFRFFQTVDLILSHFKRDADKEKIFELTGETSNFKEILISAATIHIYHNLGIRVEEDLKGDEISDISSKKQELFEKQKIYREVEGLIKNSFELEIEMSKKIISLENKILDYLIDVRKPEITQNKKESSLNEIDQYIEREILEIVLMEHPFYFYDLISDIIGYSTEIKRELHEEGSELKEISIEIEERLKKEEKADKFIELSTLRKNIDKIKEEFEFKSYKEMKLSAMPVRMVKKKILEHEMNKFPVSIHGLKAYKQANTLKQKIIEKVKSTLYEKVDYENFEKILLDFLKSCIIQKLKENPNDFVYFLEFLNESSFSEIIHELNKYGIYNILEILSIDDEIIDKVKKNMIRYNVDKFDLINLNDPKRDLIYKTKKAFNKIDFAEIDSLISIKSIEETDLIDILMKENDYSKILWNRIKTSLDFSLREFREFCWKKQIIENVFLKELNLKSYSQILISLEFNKILYDIMREILFYIFSKILRQLSRIIETYAKITNEKTLFYLAMKKIDSTKDSEKWVAIKLEELLIQRLIKRQEELAIVFDASTKPFLVNGFLYARLTDVSLENGINEFKNNSSFIYKDIKALKLKEDLISPISYCLGYDLIKRFEVYNEERKLERKKIAKLKERKRKEKKEKIRQQQEDSTLNWIERRITSSMMRIGSPGINPNQLYWQEKDTKIAVETIKIHGDREGNYINNLIEYFNFAAEKIGEHIENLKLPSKEKIGLFIKNLVNQVMQKRLQRKPSEEDIVTMLEGEKYEISKQIAQRIGKILDRALYKKFKFKKLG